MRYFLVALAIAAALLFLAPERPSKLPGSVVKLLLEGGHGSGVHIGKGYILTAAHVVASNKTIQIKTDKGGTGEADVIWFNRDYDVALIHTGIKMQASSIACEALPTGANIRATGNPGDHEFLSTWGRVSGKAVSTTWKVAIAADITLAPGMSGGGLFDEAGRLVGILVGGMAFRGVIPISYVVPASAFCGMLGR